MTKNGYISLKKYKLMKILMILKAKNNLSHNGYGPLAMMIVMMMVSNG